MKHGQTPSQTVGPFFAYGLTPEQYGYPFTQVALGTIEAKGERIKIAGQVLDGNGAPVVDALVEFWQPGIGFARQGTGTRSDCSFEFETVKPSAASPSEAPHINVIVFMRGLLSHLYTRIYFENEAAANAVDDVLLSVPTERRATLIAGAIQAGQYRFDFHLQGDNETVFFDL
jgi:protocatechuate 3,4-dioxygenase, alpha subunit